MNFKKILERFTGSRVVSYISVNGETRPMTEAEERAMDEGFEAMHRGFDEMHKAFRKIGR
jgi:hypothetical protein